MIGSEYQIVDFGESKDEKLLPVYINDTYIKIYTKPDWVTVSVNGVEYSEGSSLVVASNKVVFTLGIADGYFTPVYNDSLVFSNISNSEFVDVKVIWTFEPEMRSLSQIADSLEIDFQDTPLESVHRMKVIKKLKEGMSFLGFTGMRTVSRLEAIRNDASTIARPIDMVKFLRLYAVDDYGRMGIMYQNKYLNKGAISPLLDENDNVITDENNVWLEGSGITPQPEKESPIFSTGYWCETAYDSVFPFGKSLWTSAHGISGGVKSNFGEYIYDPSQKVFFIQDCPYDNFVIEYVSDPNLRENIGKDYGQLRIHQDWVGALKSWTYYDLIQLRSDIPQSEKERARQEKGRQAKIAKRMSLDWAELIQALKTRRNINKL